jgi:hypothetical protein
VPGSSVCCATPEVHPGHAPPEAAAPKKQSKKRGRPKRQQETNNLGDIQGVREPKLPSELDRFRISQSNASPALRAYAAPAVAAAPAAAAPVAVPAAAPAAAHGPAAAIGNNREILQTIGRLFNLLGAGQQLPDDMQLAAPAQPAAIAPLPAPIVGHVTAAAVAGQIGNDVDARREVDFLKDALRNEQRHGYQPPAHLADQAMVQNAAAQYGPAHAAWQAAPARPAVAAPVPVPTAPAAPPVLLALPDHMATPARPAAAQGPRDQQARSPSTGPMYIDLIDP